jgi:aminobenzoyl-glutamate transport protein
MIASTLLLTGVGWAVTALWVEPRYAGKPPDEGGPAPGAVDEAETALSPDERRALLLASGVAGAAFALFAALTWIPGMPLHGLDGVFPRWVRAIVPLLFLGFLLPGLVYGFAIGLKQYYYSPLIQVPGHRSDFQSVQHKSSPCPVCS